MSCAERQPLWLVRLRHWWHHQSPTVIESILTLLVLAGTGLACTILLGLGV